MAEKEQWYTNKDLFEMLQSLRAEMQSTRAELQETRTVVKQYNDLRKQLAACQQDIMEIRQQAAGRSKVWDNIRLWGGWFVAFMALVVSVYVNLIK
jgi:uncharacterized protein YhaN